MARKHTKGARDFERRSLIETDVEGWTALARYWLCKDAAVEPRLEDRAMQQDVMTVGVDLAKNVFQIHAVGSDGKVVIRRQLRRVEMLEFFSGLPPCLVGMEACASAHHRGRELIALGHEVRLMPPAYVKP